MGTTDTGPVCDECGAIATWVSGRHYRCANGHNVYDQTNQYPVDDGPIARYVHSSELSPEKGLRAQDYLINPKEEAKAVVKEWLEVTGMKRLINPNSQYTKRLYALISAAISSAYKRGASQQLQTTKMLRDIVNQPSVARQCLPMKNCKGEEL